MADRFWSTAGSACTLKIGRSGYGTRTQLTDVCIQRKSTLLTRFAWLFAVLDVLCSGASDYALYNLALWCVAVFGWCTGADCALRSAVFIMFFFVEQLVCVFVCVFRIYVYVYCTCIVLYIWFSTAQLNTIRTIRRTHAQWKC